MMKKLLLMGSAAVAGGLLVAVGVHGQAPAGGASKAAPSEARRFLNQYCVGCHGQAAKAAKMEAARHITLDDIDIDDVSKDPEKWELVVRKVRAGMMPPAGMPRPKPEQFEAWITNLEDALDRSSKRSMPPPGLHRLNRTEYANVIRDLLDIEINPAQYLPSDDSTRGFDNIAAGLTISPALLEGYISAAGKISRIALGSVTTAVSTTYRVPEDTSQDYHIEGMPFGTRGGLKAEHEFPADGDYTISIWPISKGNMGSNNPFGEIPGEKLEVILDGVRQRVFNWDNAQERRNGYFEVTIPVTAGRHTLVVTFQATNDAPGHDLNRHFLRSTLETGGLPGFRFFPHVGKVVIEGPFNAKGAHNTAARKKLFVCTPASPAEETACATQIVNNLARRAFRRPVTARDTEMLLGFFQRGRNEGGSFDAGVEMALRRVLSDPEFIFRREIEPANVEPGQPYRISDIELASRLSFFLWSSIPDEELLRVAEQGRLRQPEVLEQQVRRMLRDPKSMALVDNFAGQWLGIRSIASQVPVANYFPDFDDNLRYAMKREMELFVASVIQEDRPVTDLLDANYTFVNERLAKHYGIKNVYGSHFRKVDLPAELDYRRGLLGKGLLMTISSQPGRTSPVQRGKTVMQTFLGVEPPAPPPNVEVNLESTSDDRSATPTMRQQMEMHRKNEPCASCHKIMDPIGFALENFDAIGAWRDVDGTQPVDASGTLVDGTKLNGPRELREALVRYSPQFVRVATEKMLTYALGRGTEHFDMPLVRQIVKEAAKDNYRFSSLVLAVVKSDPFQMNEKVRPGAERPHAAAH
jgi:mono/diheme cytochrome c family protein